jgi:hypothetical protein
LHLRESSPITVGLRGVHNEVRFLVGGTPEGRAVIGRGGTLFLKSDLSWSRPDGVRQRDARRRVFADVARWADSRSAHVLVVVVPDKARILAELWNKDGRLPPPRRSEYADLLAEIRAAGLLAVDLESLFLGWRRARPAERIYLERDTHWNHRGRLLAALAVADAIRAAGLRDALGPPDGLVPLPLQNIVIVPDLPALLGFLPHGLFFDQFVQPWRAGEVIRRGAGVLDAVPGPSAPAASVALAGDSFAEGGFGPALAGALGRDVDREGAIAAGGPIQGLVETMVRVDQGTLGSRILIWVFVERALANDAWTVGPPIPDAR